MRTFSRGSVLGAAVALACAVPSIANATTGYFSLAWGAKAMGMAGAVVSAPQDALTAAVNPAATSFVGTRADMDVRGFTPIRKATLEFPDPPFGPGKQSDSSSNRIFPVPAGGFSYQVNDSWAVGFAFYGNGGMNSTYKNNLFDPGGLGGASRPLSVDLSQLIFAPSVSFKFADRHAIGIAPLIAMQKFKAEGLENFQCFTSTALSNPTSAGSCQTTGQPTTPSTTLTGNGDEIVWGVGVRAGYVGKITDQFSLGIAGASPIYMGKFDKYSDLFAEDGDFDIPGNITAGISWQSGTGLTVAFDWQRIFYEGVKSISNPGPVFNNNPTQPGPTFPPGTDFSTLPPSTALGQKDGLGFGWKDINVYRLGVAYQFNPQWTARFGVAYNDQPIPKDQVLFNVLAPATVKWHITAGATWKPRDFAELSLALMYAPTTSVKTDQTAFGVPGKIEMYQVSADLQLSVLF